MNQNPEPPVLDLKPHELVIVRAILQKLIPEIPVFVVGSRVRGFAKHYSDLDLLIDNPEELPLRHLCDLQDEFGESDLPWKVDLVQMPLLSDEYYKTMSKRMVQIHPV
ncbi:MAG: nucleotidyltransferase domain-containing protein [Candidatus Pacebacteria bacterium]|nr:nucleotidyltransferase domain-containing protein [Candidatus Paceibacterota bacterium]